MAIKASNTITLVSVTDVDEVKPYYYTQASTIQTTPSKPTSYPPPSPWSATEPAFDYSKTVFVTFCCLMNDGTYNYSDVSKWSEYEASKAAYNVASNAQQIAQALNQYFWFTQSGSDAGAHITEIPQTDFIDDPSGGNALIRSTGIALRDGMTEVATFSEQGVRTGRDSGYKTFVGTDGFSWGISIGKLFNLAKGSGSDTLPGVHEVWVSIRVNAKKVLDWLALVPRGVTVSISAPNDDSADIVAGVASENDYLSYDGFVTITQKVTGSWEASIASLSYTPPSLHFGGPIMPDDNIRVGNFSAEFGEGACAESDNQVAVGSYNVIDTYDSSNPKGNYVFIVGNGYQISRSNAFAVKRNGIIEAENVMAYGECSTASATVAKEVTVAFGSFTLQTGATIAVKFANANSASNPTLNVNGTGAKAIMRYGTTAGGTSAGASWNAGSVVSLLYDGTYWQMIDFNNTTYSGMSDAEYQAGTGTTNRLITPARLVNAIKYWAVALADKYTRSSVGHLDWSNQTDGDAKVIAKSALAFWNGCYSGTNSNLAYCNKGAFGTLATKNSLSASDVGAVPTSRKVNNKALSSDISLTAGDVGAVARSAVCYANSRVDTFSSSGQVTLSLATLGITTGAKPVGILLTYQDGGAAPTILRYDYDASSASGVVIKAYNSSGGAVSGAVRYFAVVFQSSWTSA